MGDGGLLKYVRVSCLVFLGLFVACGSSDSGRDTGDPCNGEQARCEGASFQVCGSSDTFVEEKICGAQCDVNSGCLACDPNAALSCSGDQVVQCNSGDLGAVVEECPAGTCQNGQCGGGSVNSCAQGAELIYLVDTDTNLLSFDPTSFDRGESPFQIIGSLSCPAGPDLRSGGPATPFSMSVDRGGQAWVLYSSGEIFHVSTVNASCQSTSFAPGQSGFELFGMGFVSDAANSNAETLYVSGTGEFSGSGELGRLDATTLGITGLGRYPSAEFSPELTGTGDGELYGYFPGSFSSFISELNKSNGQDLGQWPLTPPGSVNAWAFAHWGGKFYIFISVSDFLGLDSTPTVIEFDPATNSQTTVVETSPFNVVGAGVSTCAPVVVD